MSFFTGSSAHHGHRSSSSHHRTSRPSYARSSSSFFSRSGSSSYYRRSPRQGYVQYLLHKLKRLIQDLWHYARRHPLKAFFAIVVPLISAGGAIHGLLRQFGVRLPMGMTATRSYRGYYGSSGYGEDYRGGGGGGGGGAMGAMGNLIKIAQAFM